MNNWHIQCAARSVLGGGVIAYPTEAIYGLGCSPWDVEAVQRLLELKQRQVSKGLIVVAASASQLHCLVDFGAVRSLDAVLASWPLGPVTWVIPSRRDVPFWLTGQHSGLAVRVSAHPLVRALCAVCGPLVSTSANRADTRAARTSMEVRNHFGDALDYILPGRLGGEAYASEIRHAGSGEILRQGRR